VVIEKSPSAREWDTPALADALGEAARVIAGVAGGRSLTAELQRAAEEGDVPRAALIDLTHGTLRCYGRVQALERCLAKRGGTDPIVSALLWCSFYALDSGRYASYTVVDQAVRACALVGQHPAKGFVNAVLRNLLRNRSAIEASIALDEEALWKHPAWWIAKLRRAYPDQWESVLEAGNGHPPMSLRVNLRRTTVSDYLARLATAGIAARQIGQAALLLERPMPVDRLPGFRAGDVSVQDAGAQHATEYLDLAAGQRVLDACAAPGGKSGHILEAAEVVLTALDVDAQRSASIGRNLARLGHRALLKVADCTSLGAWWDGAPFDRILADVPCSSSGVVRRHPDIKWLRRESDVAGFAARQSAILQALWRLLAPGGKLLYVTCSVFVEENEAVVDALCTRTPQAQHLPLPEGAPAQLLPDAEHDGFYFALIAKRP
jgi:16S rRNA (cytosine967-C5)-methyltransferase